MSTFYLIRHGSTDPMSVRLCGRAEGIALNAEGRRQAERLALAMGDVPWQAIYSSPVQRAKETAEILARPRGLQVTESARLTEVDCGQWTGCAFEELSADPEWKRFNEQRSRRRPPGGETLADVAVRVADELELLSRLHPDANMAVVTHGDVIRTALMVYLGMPLDFVLRLEVDPASCSVFQLAEWGAVVKCVNWLPR